MSEASLHYQKAFDHLQYHGDHMNAWELGFVESLEYQFKQKGRLSELRALPALDCENGTFG